MEQNESYDEISLKELILMLIKHKRLIIIFTVIAAMLAGIISLSLNNNSKEAKLLFSINHSKITEGLNPDGSKFDKYDIASPFILNDLIKSLKMEGILSTNDIRKNIEIIPLIPKSISQEGEFAIKKEGKSNIYYPNQFLLIVKTDYNIDSDLAMKIANGIIDSYINYFTKEYVNSSPVINKIITFDFDEYDYSDTSMIFHNELDTIIDYNRNLMNIDSGYRSKNTGLSFNDIIQSVGIIDEIELNRIDSLISSYKLTKDSKKLIVYYEYLIEQFKLEKNKGDSSAGILKDMLEKIDSSRNGLIQSLSENASEEDDSYFSSLILKSSSYALDASTIQDDIDYYEKELQDIKDGVTLSNIDKNEAIKEVEGIIKDTFTYLQKWIIITNKTSSEFYEKLMTRAITPLSPAEIYTSINIKLNIMIGLILGLMVGVFYAISKEYWEKA